jgi:hypothetical protein
MCGTCRPRWLAAHQAATVSEDPHREITTDHDLADTVERQVVTEATEYRGRELGPVVVRYAHLIRDVCNGYRRVVAAYIDAAAAGAPPDELAVRRAAVGRRGRHLAQGSRAGPTSAKPPA